MRCIHSDWSSSAHASVGVETQQEKKEQWLKDDRLTRRTDVMSIWLARRKP